MRQIEYDVYLKGMCIDTVFFDEDASFDEVKRYLINHDEYDPKIEIYECE